MTNSIVRSACVAGALAIQVLAPSVASAATLTFGLTGSSATSGTDANSFTQTLTRNGATVKVRVSAWSLTNTSGSGTVYDSYLGRYGTGFGATSGDENGGGSTHTVDNQNRRDFLVFQFDQAVSLKQALFTAYPVANNVYDTDFTFGFGTAGGAFSAQPALDGRSFAQLQSFFGGGLFNVAGSTLTSNRAVQTMNAANRYGNVWLIGASFANSDRRIDAFKLSQLRVQTAPVPEAATWTMMIAGFGVAGVALRRKTAKRLATA